VDSSPLLSVLEIYFKAFAEDDPGRRIELLARCMTEDGEIWGPNLHFTGYEAISEKIAAFHRNWPDCRLVLASGLVTFGNFARGGVAFVRNGVVIARGESITEFAEDGRIATVVPFWELKLPSLPESWPREWAVPAPLARQMLEIKLSVELASSAERVWEVTGSFAGLADWHPWVESSVLEPASGGMGRRVTNVGGTAGRRELIERLVFFDAAAREYAYTIIAGPTPFVDYVGRFRVVPRNPERCVFEYSARFNTTAGSTDAEATERIRTFYEAGLANLTRLFGA
jgi:hypothetical protein